MVAVAIDNQPGNAVGLAPNQPGQRFVDGKPFAQLDRLVDAALEKIQVQILAATRKPAGDDLRFRIENGGSQRPVAEIFQRDHVSRLGIAEGFFDFSGINPLVTVKNACARSDDETCHGAGITAQSGRIVEPETQFTTSQLRFPLDTAIINA